MSLVNRVPRGTVPWAAGTTTALLFLFGAFHIQAADSATYQGLKPDEFMKRWLILKPIPVAAEKKAEPTEAAQKKAFAEDLLAAAGGEAKVRPTPGMKQKIAGRDLEWQLLESKKDLIDLEPGSHPSDFAIAYAWAEIDMPEKTKALLGLGSDDAVKIWLNGKLLHKNWTARAAHEDDDVIPIEFERGKNQILLKIQNIQGGWSFFCRIMGPEAQAEKLIAAARAADLDAVKRALDQGPDINSRGRTGLTAWQSARLLGQTEVVNFLASRGADTNAEMPPPEKTADRLLTSLMKPDDPGLSVLVAQNGKVLFDKAYGLADLEHHTPFTPETESRIGSITKQFTAAAILKLQEEGKLSVTNTLSKFIPDFPRGDEVILVHLLTHTSGIHSYTGKPGFLDHVTNTVQTLELIQSFKSDPYDFDPGKKWLYNNSGYFLLGYIIEKVSGQSYGDFLQANFFAPLGMTNTGVHRAGLKLEHEALGYQFVGGSFTNALNWNMSQAGGAGALYSTVEDLYRWNEAVFNGKVLSDTTLKDAFSPVKTEENKDDASDSGYGYGWGLGRLRGAQEISHGGGLNGFSSYLLRLPRYNFTVAILANSLPVAPGTEPAILARQIVALYLGEKLEPLPVLVANKSVSPKSFDAVAGRYDYGEGILTVKREGDHLFAQLGSQPRFEIFPKSETEFFWKVVDAQVTFVKDKDGKVVKAIHHQNGRTINAPRLEDLVADKRVSPAAFDALVGRYGYPDGILTVKREGEHLFAQLGDQPRYEIFPKTETNFFWKIVDAQVTFVKDKDGKVVKAIHHQNGRTTNAPRLEDLVAAKVDPASYDGLLGKYDYGQGKAILTVSRDGDRLFAQLTGQPKFEIFPKSANEFFWKVVDAQVTFVKDENGKVTKAIHRQSGQTLEAPKME